MKQVVIIGGGFAGISAALSLCSGKKLTEIILIDKTGKHNFLPMLPDIIGRGIKAGHLLYDIKSLSGNFGFKAIIDEVVSIDLENKLVLTKADKLSYDYLLIASGAETNFYGNEPAKKYLYRLDNVADAEKILDDLASINFDYYVIFGGGYTGIEIATAIRRYLNKKGKNKKIIIAEKSSSILGPLPQWLKDYVYDNLKELNIEVCLNSVIIDKIEERKVQLSCLDMVNNAMLIWSAGVKTAGFMQGLAIEKSPQGRLKVDEYLRIDKSSFVAGDAANFLYKNDFLRMAVQFAITQGNCAAANIIRSVRGLRLRKYRPRDLGYIIPMANNRSCGRVLGLNMKGFLPTIFHFIMCIYRSYGSSNKAGIIKDLCKGGRNV